MKRKSYLTDDYWGKPVPNFGDPEAKLLIVGLAPAAHGANRTGRMFTGDRSGDWLFRALHKVGVANQSDSVCLSDGLILTGVLITAICHCAPPDNKPTPEEIKNCNPFLAKTLTSREWKSILCLGKISWDQTIRTLKSLGQDPIPTEFTHGSMTFTNRGTKLLGSYHPSQQNTFTKRLTELMFDDVIGKFAREL